MWKLVLLVSVIGAGTILLFRPTLNGIFGYYPGAIAKSKFTSVLTNLRHAEIDVSGKAVAISDETTLSRLREALSSHNSDWEVLNTTRVAPREFIVLHAGNNSRPISFGYSDRNLMFYSEQDFYYIKPASEQELEAIKSLFKSLSTGVK